MSYEEDRERIRQLALLCLETRELTDEELNQVVASGNKIGEYFDRLSRFVEYGARREKRYRLRRTELEKLSTEELQQMNDLINHEWGCMLADDVNDELPDSCFEAPAIDSDGHIVRELLEKRKEKASAT